MVTSRKKEDGEDRVGAKLFFGPFIYIYISHMNIILTQKINYQYTIKYFMRSEVFMIYHQVKKADKQYFRITPFYMHIK